ncbi:hypothetical protein CYY_003256 [Polysphondylium violaceum]|uniref:CDP-alcohol phosphatidyltransferase n=1 Tax=Polysphondylium violaceum TaxID=133409 RepID=A0A8J4PXT6_9MYCE|nr:hypothetical protein CYY_003256 [Polysphondylium violaceum]
MGYITKKGGFNLPTYKGGTTIDNSLMYNYVISPTCNVLVEYIPKCIAPNLITAIGLFCQLLGLGLACYYLGFENTKDDSHRWVHLFSGAMVFIYMMLDNIDGKQARRTKTSSPLGELFDHGCDSWTVGLAPMIVGISVGISLEKIVIAFLLATIPFYLAHWEEYFTHHLVLGALNGPTEAECGVILLCVVTFFTGQSFWFQEFNFSLLHDSGVISFQLNELLFTAMILISLFTALQSIVASTQKALQMNINLFTAYSQLLPFTIFFVCETIWLVVSPQLFLSNPVVHIISLTAIFSYLTCRCIVQRICQEDFRLFYKPLIFLIASVANSIAINVFKYTPIITEEYTLYALCAISLIFFAHFTFAIINEMCGILKIQAFTVPKEKQK